MRYPVVIDKDPDSDYCILVPDLPGCITAGDSVKEVLIQAVEAIKCHLSGMLVDGEPIPEPQSIEYHQNNPDYACFQRWDWVTITLPELRHYPVLMFRKRHHYRLIVPDLPGCVVRGKTALDALAKAGLAIERHMAAMVLKNEAIPKPNASAAHQGTATYADGHWESVPIIVPEIEHLLVARPGIVPRLLRGLGFTRLPWRPRPVPSIRQARPPDWKEGNTQPETSELETTPQLAQTD